MASKKSISIILVSCALLAAVIIITMQFRNASSSEQATGAQEGVLAEGIDLSTSIPDEIIRGQPYEIRILIEELEGRPRTVTGMRIEGFMLTRALQPGFTEPTFIESNSNIADGWVESTYSLSLPAESTLTLTMYADARRAGPANGTISIELSDGSESSIPVKYEIIEP
ncbi:MAG: hypothetical protein ACX94C_13010 [Phycisphaerales bacterium]